MNNKKLTIAFLVAFVVAVGGYFFPAVPKVVAGAISTAANITSSRFTQLTVDDGIFLDGVFSQGQGTNVAIDLQTDVTTGYCASATSTMFAVANPFNATSTATIYLEGYSNATTTTFYVGTSTVAVGLSSSSVSPTLINQQFASGTVATTIVSGLTVGSYGQLTSGTGTFSRIMVGPSDYIAGYATSTYSGVEAKSYSSPSCTYKIKWEY